MINEVAADDEAEKTTGTDKVDSAGVSLSDEMDALYGPRSGAYQMRQRRRPIYDLSMLAHADSQLLAPTFDATQLAMLETSLEPLI